MIVTFKKSFEKDLGKLRDADLLHKIQAVIEEAEAAVSPIDIKNLKKLKADGNYYRIRVGNYRIGLVLDEAEISFVRVLHRKEMYRYFPYSKAVGHHQALQRILPRTHQPIQTPRQTQCDRPASL